MLTYLCQVNYNADGFLEKNRDSLSQTLVDCLVSSTNDVVGALFLACLSDTGSISGYYISFFYIKSNILPSIHMEKSSNTVEVAYYYDGEILTSQNYKTYKNKRTISKNE